MTNRLSGRRLSHKQHRTWSTARWPITFHSRRRPTVMDLKSIARTLRRPQLSARRVVSATETRPWRIPPMAETPSAEDGKLAEIWLA